MDMNKHIISSSLVQELQRLGLVEATNEVWQDEEPHTWLVFILAGAVCVVWDFFLVQVYARVDLYLFSMVT
jgi:hypothetical protein